MRGEKAAHSKATGSPARAPTAQRIMTQLGLLRYVPAIELVCEFQASELAGIELVVLLESGRIATRSWCPALVEHRVMSDEVALFAHWLRREWKRTRNSRADVRDGFA